MEDGADTRDMLAAVDAMPGELADAPKEAGTAPVTCPAGPSGRLCIEAPAIAEAAPAAPRRDCCVTVRFTKEGKAAAKASAARRGMPLPVLLVRLAEAVVETDRKNGYE